LYFRPTLKSIFTYQKGLESKKLFNTSDAKFFHFIENLIVPYCSVTCRTCQVNRRFLEFEPPMKIILSSNLLAGSSTFAFGNTNFNLPASEGQPSLLGVENGNVSNLQNMAGLPSLYGYCSIMRQTCHPWQVYGHKLIDIEEFVLPLIS
jgi:hypothetical protein